MIHQPQSVIIVQRLLPHYRLPFFRALAEHNSGLDIGVYYGETDVDGNISGFASRKFYNRKLTLFRYSLVFQFELMWEVLRSRPDLVIIEGTFGVLTNFFLLLIRWVLRLPTIFWAAGWDNPEISGWRSVFKRAFIRLCLSMCAGAIVYGTAAKEYLAEHGLARNRIIVAQNTVDVESLITDYETWKIRGELIRRKYHLSLPFVITYVGHLTPMKRVHILLEAYYRLRAMRNDICLLIVGTGPQELELKQFVQSHSVPDVQFAGEIIDGVEAFFAASNLFVLPGTGGLALNQAMALRLPMIATVADGTQIDLVIPGQNGEIVPVDDVDALVNALDRLLSSVENLKRLGENSLNIVRERATLQNMVSCYSTAIRKSLEQVQRKA